MGRQQGLYFTIRTTFLCHGSKYLKIGLTKEKCIFTKYSEEQAEKEKNLCKKLANLQVVKNKSCVVVLDDEKNSCDDGSNMQRNDNYYTNDKSNCSDSVCFAEKEKYADKVIIWVAISNRGISKPLFRPSKSEAVNWDIYIYAYIATFHP